MSKTYQYNGNSREMYMFVCLFVVLKALVSNSISVHKHYDEIISKSKVELQPYLINGLLNDIVIISAPELYKSAEYYLYKPTGEFTKLDIPRKNTKTRYLHNILVTYKKNLKIESDTNKFRIYNIYGNLNKSLDVVSIQDKSMGANEFMIGPLLPEDHGNWVLSVFVRDVDDQYIELFQVITIEITEPIDLNKGDRTTVRKGDTLHLSFIYPISNLEMCQLVAPNTTYDRVYDRSPVDMNKCGYVVHNMTDADGGHWKIIGVGKMVYKGETFVTVSSRKNESSHIKVLSEKLIISKELNSTSYLHNRTEIASKA